MLILGLDIKQNIKAKARWTAETIRVQPNSRDTNELSIKRILSSPHLHCIETAQLYSEIFGPKGQRLTEENIKVEPCPPISTPNFWRFKDSYRIPGESNSGYSALIN